MWLIENKFILDKVTSIWTWLQIHVKIMCVIVDEWVKQKGCVNFNINENR